MSLTTEGRPFLTPAEAEVAVAAGRLHLEMYGLLAAEAMARLKPFWYIRPEWGAYVDCVEQVFDARRGL